MYAALEGSLETSAQPNEICAFVVSDSQSVGEECYLGAYRLAREEWRTLKFSLVLQLLRSGRASAKETAFGWPFAVCVCLRLSDAVPVEVAGALHSADSAFVSDAQRWRREAFRCQSLPGSSSGRECMVLCYPSSEKGASALSSLKLHDSMQVVGERFGQRRRLGRRELSKAQAASRLEAASLALLLRRRLFGRVARRVCARLWGRRRGRERRLLLRKQRQTAQSPASDAQTEACCRGSR